MEKHAFVNGANQHGALADGVVIEMIVAGGVGFGVGDGLHGALELDEEDVDAGGGFVGGAIAHDAGDGAGVGRGAEGEG
jgi:hypothetical protein